PIVNSTIWEGEFAAEDVPDECKASFVQTVGVISPIKVADGVETYGELEVMRFIRQMKHQENNFLLVDSRGSEWYEYETIPGAVNLWYAILKKPEVFAEEYAAMLKRIGVTKGSDGTYDCSNAATLLLFCNGPWCGQSPMAIRELLKLGYPAKKIKWYRGGMHDWKSLSMTTTLSEEEED
ncbi:MAG: rhodanese-like domain-containing protein, partial [Campylobacterota bacterium]|nr:rhodanese-like domain-containing protein [Campylobacterota bacterium]